MRQCRTIGIRGWSSRQGRVKLRPFRRWRRCLRCGCGPVLVLGQTGVMQRRAVGVVALVIPLIHWSGPEPESQHGSGRHSGANSFSGYRRGVREPSTPGSCEYTPDHTRRDIDFPVLSLVQNVALSPGNNTTYLSCLVEYPLARRRAFNSDERPRLCPQTTSPPPVFWRTCGVGGNYVIVVAIALSFQLFWIRHGIQVTRYNPPNSGLDSGGSHGTLLALRWRA